MMLIERVNRKRLEDLQQEEFGSWEDFGKPEREDWRDPEYGDTAHAYVILSRHETKLELRSLAEAGLILYHVIDNSIDKANGWVEERAEGARAWRDWLVRLRTRIKAEVGLLLMRPENRAEWAQVLEANPFYSKVEFRWELSR